MLGIAILAGFFRVCGVIEGIGVLIAISAGVLPVVMASPARRLSVAAWVGSLYPVLLLSFLYATWLTAWCTLGHRPSSHDDPKHISVLVYMLFVSSATLVVGLLRLAPLLSAYFVIVQAVVSIRSEGLSPFQAALRLFLALSLWLLVLAIARCDALGWLMAGLLTP
jgi:hypothetical protein